MSQDRDDDKVVTIQQTSKKWKAVRAISMLSLIGIIVLGIIAVNLGANSFAAAVIFGALGVVAICLYIVGWAMTWWHHG